MLSFMLSALFFGSAGAAVVWARNGWGIPGAHRPATGTVSSTLGAAAATPPPNTTPEGTPTATAPGPDSSPQPTPAVGVTQVPIENYAFQPTVIQVQSGTTVTWTNQDRAPHTVTFENGMADSGMLNPGDSFQYTFTYAGTFRYICVYHPGMVATVIVTT